MYLFFLISSFKVLIFLEFEYQIFEYFKLSLAKFYGFISLTSFIGKILWFYFMVFGICSSKRKCLDDLDFFEHLVVRIGSQILNPLMHNVPKWSDTI